MAAYFLDSSAVAKIYVAERGSNSLTGLVDPGQHHEIFVVALTLVEVAAVLFRKFRASALSSEEAAGSVRALREDFERTYRVVEFGPPVSDAALDVAQRHGLRGYDCVQLGAALTVHQDRAPAHLPSIAFVSADAELNAAARAEGLQVLDPNHYP